VLVGIGTGSSVRKNVLTQRVDDTTKDAEALAKKILGLRLFNDESNQQMWKRSVKDIDGEILCGNPFCTGY
jgi:D-Tyr-tRNAtyr deacylase